MDERFSEVCSRCCPASPASPGPRRFFCTACGRRLRRNDGRPVHRPPRSGDQIALAFRRQVAAGHLPLPEISPFLPLLPGAAPACAPFLHRLRPRHHPRHRAFLASGTGFPATVPLEYSTLDGAQGDTTPARRGR